MIGIQNHLASAKSKSSELESDHKTGQLMLLKTDLMLFKTKHLRYVTHIRARTFLVELICEKRHHNRQKYEKSETHSLSLLIQIEVLMAMQQKLFQNFSPGKAKAFGNNIEMEP